MKRLVACLVALTVMCAFSVGFAREYAYGELSGYTIVSRNQNTYLYAKPTEKSAIISAYSTGMEVGMLNYNIHEVFALVTGPDGKTGYIKKASLMKAFDYVNPRYRSYRITSTFLGGVAYMYLSADADDSPIKVLYNDMTVKAVADEAEKGMLLVVDPENTAGYVFESFLTPEAAFAAEAVLCVANDTCFIRCMPVEGSAVLTEMWPGQTAQALNWNEEGEFVFVRDSKTGRYGYAQKELLEQLQTD